MPTKISQGAKFSQKPNMENNLTILSINVRRQANTDIHRIIYHTQKQNANIILLQETNMLSPKTRHKLQTIYDLEIYENPGNIFARGVVTLISRNLNQYVIKHENWGTETGRITEITRQSEMANTSPATCQCLATFTPLK